VCGGKPSAAVMESGEGAQNWSGHRDARQARFPQRVGISQRTTGRVLTFVPLEERVDILPQPNDGGLAHRIIRLATEILFNALHNFNG
jgi:hypothetical protein